MAFTVKAILPVHTQKIDFNGDGKTDLLWRGADGAGPEGSPGTVAAWNMSADGLSGTPGLFLPNPSASLVLKGVIDISGDGTTDLVWQDFSGRLETWEISNNRVIGVTPLTQYGINNSQIQAVGDFNGDGHADLLWFARPAPVPGGADGVWYTSTAEARPIPPYDLGNIKPFSIDFQFVGVGDFNGDGKDDILFRGTGNATVGTMMIQQSETFHAGDTGMQTTPLFFGDPRSSWSVLGLADFNGDGKTDILWQHTNAAGDVDARSIWNMDGKVAIGGGMVPYCTPDWSIVGADDYNNDGRADLLWRNSTTGNLGEWRMGADGNFVAQGGFGNPGDFWTIG